MSCFVIAEAGVNHNGSLDLALRLVDAAAAAGVNAVKFQTFRADNLIAPGTPKAEYQLSATGTGDQLSMVRALELSEEAHFTLARRCLERGVEFMSTPFDEWGIQLLLRLGVRRLKVASGELTNRPLLEKLARARLPIILSTGMATLAEVEEAVDWLRATWAQCGMPLGMQEVVNALIVLHCVSNYPTAPSDVNLRAMVTLRDSLRVPVGFSDHTAGIHVSIAAVALGAMVIEKHLTLDRSLPGPDHRASLEPGELLQMVRGIRAVEEALGDGHKAPRPSELAVRDLVRRSVTLVAAVNAGHVLSNEDLTLLRPGTGILPRDIQRVVGRKVRLSLPIGHTLTWPDLE